MTFISIITERPIYGTTDFNLVAYSMSPRLLDVHSQLVDAADIIQARYRFSSFLLEASFTDTADDIDAVNYAFELSRGSRIFCVPFDFNRQLLADAEFYLTDFQSYGQFFDALRGESDVDINEIWQKRYDTVGFMMFRLILS